MSTGIKQDLMDAVASVVRVGETFAIQDIADMVPKHDPQYVSRMMASLAAGDRPAIDRISTGVYRLVRVRSYQLGDDSPRPRKPQRDTEPCPVCFWVPSLSGKCGCD